MRTFGMCYFFHYILHDLAEYLFNNLVNLVSAHQRKLILQWKTRLVKMTEFKMTEREACKCYYMSLTKNQDCKHYLHMSLTEFTRENTVNITK